jgi:hypothetical protein
MKTEDDVVRRSGIPERSLTRMNGLIHHGQIDGDERESRYLRIFNVDRWRNRRGHDDIFRNLSAVMALSMLRSVSRSCGVRSLMGRMPAGSHFSISSSECAEFARELRQPRTARRGLLHLLREDGQKHQRPLYEAS